MIRADNEGFEGLHDVTVVVTIPKFGNGKSSSPTKTAKNSEAKFRIDVSAPLEPPKLINQRSSETLALAGAVEIGDKISKIEDNEEIPIYYSDQSMTQTNNQRNDIFADN